MSYHRFTSLARQRVARHWSAARLLVPTMLLDIACENPCGGDCNHLRQAKFTVALTKIP